MHQFSSSNFVADRSFRLAGADEQGNLFEIEGARRQRSGEEEARSEGEGESINGGAFHNSQFYQDKRENSKPERRVDWESSSTSFLLICSLAFPRSRLRRRGRGRERVWAQKTL